MKIQEILSKSIITPSKLPDTDYVVNPYTGCQFACLYCYASFMGRFVNEPIESWGNYVYIKINAVELFKKEIKALKRNRPNAEILLSSVTDAYHGVEKKYRLTRGILELVKEENYQGLISILTKSPLILDDLGLIKSIPNIEVGITITSTDDKISRYIEVKAPSATSRLKTLKKLNDNGIKTYAFIGPLLPHFQLNESLIDGLFKAVAATGTKDIYVEHLNMSNYIKKRIFDGLSDDDDEIKQFYLDSKTKDYRNKLDEIVNKMILKYALNLRLSGTIYHKDLSIK